MGLQAEAICGIIVLMDSSEKTETAKPVRPSKKQRELLSFIETFIGEHGYSPSYREIMTGCNYTSVATVSLHVNSLIKRGHLRKRENSARSLEVVQVEDAEVAVTEDQNKEEQWLVNKIEQLFKEIAEAADETKVTVKDLETLIAGLKILGLSEPAQKFSEQLVAIQDEPTTPDVADG